MISKSGTYNTNLKNTNKKNSNYNINIVTKKILDEAIFNLSEDIKQYQHYLKILGPHHKNVESLNMKILSKLSENNHEIIQFILNKKKRNNEELTVIKTFLSTMKYLSSMISIIDTDKILFSLSVYLKMESKNKDSVLFRYGNKGNKFYILLSGQVTILLLKETKVQLSFLRYIQHLFLLKMMKEDELVKKTIIANYKNKHHLDEKSFDIFFDKIKKYEKDYKNKKNEEINDFEEESNEESEIYSEKDIRLKESKELFIKKRNTLQLNYLCSNFNERLNSKNYKIDTDIYKSEEKKNNQNNISHHPHNHLTEKAHSVSVEPIMTFRQTSFQPMKLNSTHNSNMLNLGSPLFSNEEEVEEILAFYTHLKESLKNFKKIKMSVNDYIRDTYIDSSYCKILEEDLYNKKEQFIIYLYYEIIQKNKGDTFGELALQHEDSKRTATILTNTDCILGYLSKNDYETCLSEIELKRRKNEVNFIMSFAIFDQMNWISFENKYFNYFKREYYYQGETILKQGVPINKIYFIMDGQFEITSSLSIASLYKIIRQKTNYSFQKMKIHVKKKLNNLRLCICNNKDILGLNDFCFIGLLGEQISFVDATCISTKSIAFTLDKTILGELQNKMYEIKENIKQIMKKRDKVMLDRLISIFNQLIKNTEIDVRYKMNLKKQKNNLNKKNICYVLNNSQINYILKGSKKEEKYSPYNNVLLSAKYREKSPSSIDTKSKNIINTDNNLYNGNILQERRLYSSYRLKNNNTNNLINNINPFDNNNNTQKVSDKNYRKRIAYIMSNRDNMPTNENPRIYLKSDVSIRDLTEKTHVKEKMKNLYLPINNIINKEYKNLFGWINYTKKLSESQKKLNYEEKEYKTIIKERKGSEFGDEDGDDDKKISFSSEENNDDKETKNIYMEEKKNRNKSNKNLKIRRTLKSLVMEKEKEDMKKKIKNLKKKVKPKSNYNKNNYKTINGNENAHYNKINIKRPFSLINPNNKKYKSISNESYLKQILGNRYKNEEDDFISRTEKKLIKEFNDYNINLKKKQEGKIRFLKKKNKEKKISYVNIEFKDEHENINNKYNNTNENNKENNNDLLFSHNFNISKLKRTYVGVK